MNKITDLNIEALDKTNGATSQYKFTLNSDVMLLDGDILYIDLPEELSLDTQISCSGLVDGTLVGVIDATC